MLLSHCAKFQLLINFFRVSVHFVVFLTDYYMSNGFDSSSRLLFYFESFIFSFLKTKK